MTTITDIKKKVLFNYNTNKKYEAGIILQKWEIKSIKKNGFNITGSYAKIYNKKCIMINSNITSLRNKFNIYEFNEKRDRELLLTKKELIYLHTLLNKKDATLIPAKIYWKNNKIKIELLLCTGKKQYDKRKQMKEQELIQNEYKIITESSKIY